MLTIRKIGSSEGARHYYAEYAIEKGEAPGRFVDFTKELNIDQRQVETIAVESLLNGFDPSGTKSLCQNAGPDHHPGWDLTYSAPKSVSIVWSSGDATLRSKIEQAHARAVESSLAFINETAGFTRSGKGGRTVEPVDLVFATFQHSSNRHEEPQLHTHTLLFNVAKTRRDNRWRTIHPRPIYRAYMAAGSIYKVELSHQLRELGFQVLRTKDSFEIKGVPSHVCEAQSTGAREVERKLAEAGLNRDLSTAQAREIMNLESRRGKERVVRDFERWQRENSDLGFTSKRLSKVLKKSQKISPMNRLNRTILGRETLQRITAERSTFNIYELYRRLADQSIGETDVSSILETVKDLKKSGLLKYLGKNEQSEERFSTPEMAGLENENVELVNSRLNEGKHQIRVKDINTAISSRAVSGKPMTLEQQSVLKFIADSPHGVVFIEGDAGTGKSFVMDAVREVYERNGIAVQGISFTNKAAKELQQSANLSDCRSVDSFLYQDQLNPGAIKRRSVAILDEAGMIDSRKMNKLLKVTAKYGIKLVVVGDEKQIQPIMAGQIHASLKARFGSKRLSEIFRQTRDWEKKAVAKFAKGQVRESLNEFSIHNQVKVSSNRDFARKTLVADWYRQFCSNPKSTNLIVASTNEEVDNLNDLARAKLLQDKRIGRGHIISTNHGEFRFSKNDRIIFTGNHKRIGIYNSEFARIESVNPLTFKITAKTDMGKDVTFDPFKMKDFRHGYAITTHKSQGATVDKVYTLYDGYFMDREKGYVAMSRAREGNMIYSDRATLGNLSFEERKALQSIPKGERKLAEDKLYRMKLSDLLSRSNRKDTTLDYSPETHSSSLLHQKSRIIDYTLSPLSSLLNSMKGTSNDKSIAAGQQETGQLDKNSGKEVDHHER